MSTEHRLYYHKPATTFPSSLPLGNGRLGASVLSSPNHESFILNEVTFWSGKPHTGGADLVARSSDPKAELREIQHSLLAGDHKSARERCNKYLVSKEVNFGTNLPVGRLHIVVNGKQNSVTSFERELRLDDAVAETRYESRGHSFKRRCFVSHPHQVLVVDFETKDPDGLKLEIGVKGENKAFAARCSNDQMEFDVQALETVHSDGVCGVKGRGAIGVKADQGNGKVDNKDNKLVVTAKKNVTILLALNTDYQQKGDSWKKLASRQINEALQLSVDDLLSEHIADYQPLYRRTSISLGPSAASATSLPTDKRRERFEPAGYDDPALFALYFHYARYLNIAGNRATSPLPLHLQGLWNDGEACKMGWSCDYHLDINTQMNYFTTFPGDLADLMGPMISYLESLAVAGKEAAKVCYGCDGWVAHVFSNVWGFADPGWSTEYGLNVTGGLWMASHMIEMYEYVQDDKFLAETAYPLLKGAAEFFLDYMVEDKKTGWLLTGPSISPENSFYVNGKDGKKEEHICLSPTIDIVLLRDLFAFCIHGAKKLSIDADFAKRVEAAQAKMPPFQVGKLGQLQEWLEDYEEAQPFHRHMSHTIALFRSALISLRHTPDLAKSVGVTLERRQGRDDLEDIEFTASLFASNYARLNDAEKAVKQIGHLVGELSFDNLLSYSKPGVAGAEANIFVVDGNFGGGASIAELIVRSVIPQLGKEVEIDLLPALPKAWSEGNVKGLRLRGNLQLAMEWAGGKLKKAGLKASSPGAMAVYYGEFQYNTSYKAGDIIELGADLKIIG